MRRKQRAPVQNGNPRIAAFTYPFWLVAAIRTGPLGINTAVSECRVRARE